MHVTILGEESSTVIAALHALDTERVVRVRDVTLLSLSVKSVSEISDISPLAQPNTKRRSIEKN